MTTEEIEKTVWAYLKDRLSEPPEGLLTDDGWTLETRALVPVLLPLAFSLVAQAYEEAAAVAEQTTQVEGYGGYYRLAGKRVAARLRALKDSLSTDGPPQ